MKIEQDVEILQQLLSGLTGKDGNSFTINFIENLIAGDGTHISDGPETDKTQKARIRLPAHTLPPDRLKYIFEHDEERAKIFFEILSSFPQPRLEHLFYHVYRVCVEQGGFNNFQISKFLDQVPSTITSKMSHYRIKQIKGRKPVEDD